MNDSLMILLFIILLGLSQSKSGKIHLKLVEFILVTCLTLVLLIYQDDSFPLFLFEVESRRTKFQMPRAIREILTSNALSPCWTWTGATGLFAWLIPSSINPRRDGLQFVDSFATLYKLSWVNSFLYC